ncbi:MAG: prepilin-type N-terminal cleavage/methylation domain-containing protein [Phycisphaeraceae bacterium]|nr:MAG: prepilin-type N-terminal cleavage/methylation domain-containing protein [Phycisphaeraceae bacterium]
MRKQVRHAFTLVEILIVVVILGILAAIVVPQFTNATQDAQAGNIKAQLDTINNQIELYRAKTNGYPADLVAGGANAWDDMVTAGYIKTPPKNPFNGASSVGSAVTDGWHWYDINGDGTDDSIGATNFDENTGEITPGVL